MSTLPWVIAALITAVTCVILFFIAIARKRWGAFYLSIGLFLLTILFAGLAIFRFGQRAIDRVGLFLEPRSGMEIYAALLGAPQSDCVKILASQDQVVPKLDTAIRLHVRTCPAEMARILGKDIYVLEHPAPVTAAEGTDPFSPALLGDPVLTFSTVIEPGRNWRTIHLNRDSTEAIVIDTLD